MNLENYGVQEMNESEIRETDGGLIATVPGWLKKLGWGYVVTVVIDNWSDIKSGAIDGWNDAN